MIANVSFLFQLQSRKVRVFPVLEKDLMNLVGNGRA